MDPNGSRTQLLQNTSYQEIDIWYLNRSTFSLSFRRLKAIKTKWVEKIIKILFQIFFRKRVPRPTLKLLFEVLHLDDLLYSACVEFFKTFLQVYLTYTNFDRIAERHLGIGQRYNICWFWFIFNRRFRFLSNLLLF